MVKQFAVFAVIIGLTKKLNHVFVAFAFLLSTHVVASATSKHDCFRLFGNALHQVIQQTPQNNQPAEFPDTPSVCSKITEGEIQQAAEQGDADAQFLLGILGAMHLGASSVGLQFPFPIEVEPNDAAKWLKWLMLAAEQGHEAALEFIQTSQNLSENNPEMMEQAIEAARFGAEQGRVQSQFILGLFYQDGKGVEKDEKEAVKWFRLAAEQGHLDAQVQLARAYELGRGVRKDLKESLKWFRLAAGQGDKDLQYRLGRAYARGDYVSQDSKEAAKWFRLAAEQGHAKSQQVLAVMYLSGEGVPQDSKEAIKWFRKTAAQHPDSQKQVAQFYAEVTNLATEEGEAAAQNFLGAMYYLGEKVPHDYKEAVKWFHLAAEQGNSDAQYNLATAYQTGEGVFQDKQEAYIWFSLAALSGNQKMKIARNLAKKELTASEIQQADKEAEQRQQKIDERKATGG